MNLIERRRQMMMSKSLPYDAEIEYLESTGTQYIDTGVVPNTETICELQYFRVRIVHSWQSVLACRTSEGSDDSFMLNLGLSNTSFNIHFGNMKWDTNFETDEEANAKHIATFKAGIATMDGMEGTVGTVIVPTNKNAYLFARNNNGIVSNFFYGRVYLCKLWDGQMTIRDYIPVRIGQVGYMYDRVSGQLFGNQGTGKFVLGPDKA